MTDVGTTIRLTQYAAGGGCACKVPPGELERIVSGLPGGKADGDLVVGIEHGDDAAVVRIDAIRSSRSTCWPGRGTGSPST